MSPLGRVRALAADPGVRATAVTRLIALAGAPVSIWLAATRLAAGVQGYYFVAVNVIALAQLFEIGIGTTVVQSASHLWPRLAWGAGGAFEGDADAVASAQALLRTAVAWYGKAAAALALLAGGGGILLFAPAYAAGTAAFVVPWLTFVVLTALYLPVIPFIATAEGCGALLSVQRMRSVQAVALLAGLWIGIATVGALGAACLGAAAQLLVAAAWLLARHPGLVGQALRRMPPATRYRVDQSRSARLWLALYVAPQLLTPIALRVVDGDAAGRLGVTLAIALAPLTLAAAWLHGRYPSYGALVAERRLAEFDALARRSTGEAVVVFMAGTGAIVLLVQLLPSLLPSVAVRVLDTWSLVALFGGALASLLVQAMAGWLRAFRDEGIAGSIIAGALVMVAAAVTGALMNGVRGEVVAFAVAALGVAVPLAGWHLRRERKERLAGR